MGTSSNLFSPSNKLAFQYRRIMDETMMGMFPFLIMGFDSGCKDMFQQKVKECNGQSDEDSATLASSAVLDLLRNKGLEITEERAALVVNEMSSSQFLTLVMDFLKEDFAKGSDQATNVFFRCFLLALQCLLETFNLGDKDGNGKITVGEMQKWAEMCKKDAEKEIKEFDRDGDGQMSFEEFRDEILKIDWMD